MRTPRTPDDNLITFTLAQMNARLTERIDVESTHPGTADVTHLRSGLLYMGNVHDAVPRRLLLDTRLSPQDKQAWIMIRLYAQQNQGAVFPTYDELQLQLASPYKGQASRETVSRVLLMLRLTGWLSLCRRVRDGKGRVRGNIYAQHDEPLSARDAETLDPTWLDTVAQACRHKNRMVSQTAWAALSDIQHDPSMRHQHSQLAAIAERLGAPQTPQQMVARVALRTGHHRRSATERDKRSPGSKTEPSEFTRSSETELSLKSATYSESTKPNCNVRSFTHSVIKKTYVATLPAELRGSMAADDHRQITSQLQALPEEQARQVLESLAQTMARGGLNNPTGWLLAVIKRARNGELYAPGKVIQSSWSAAGSHHQRPATVPVPVAIDMPDRRQPASREHVSAIVAKLRQEMARVRNKNT
ncbi:helix-turn-helix domain-containing protein [Serratia ureilytica]|uniref:STY4528 family pathogenicity island replication protein n=1 Tax=Serratia ureilytica TaxID=300181 RepID=UPI0039B6816A